MQFGPRALMSKMAFLPSGVTAGRDKANAKGQDDRWAGLARGVLEHGRQGGGVLARVGSEGAAVAGGGICRLPPLCRPFSDVPSSLQGFGEGASHMPSWRCPQLLAESP